jgi:hypothetical protein
MAEDWTAAEYERQKRRFIDSRLTHRGVFAHASLIFAGTLGAGWLCSWALLKLGMANLPLRYAIGFVASYAVFLLLVRVWADFMRTERAEGSAVLESANAMPLDEGCFYVIAAWAVGLVLAALFAMTGGLPLLLEVAFEVVFAGVIVRRARRIIVVGDWLGALLRRTWVHAAIAGLLLVVVAAWVQHQVPEAHTLRAALQVLLKRP